MASHVFHRFPDQEMLRAERGDGVYIVDDRGKRYLDASGGAAVSCLGHSHPAPIAAVREQVEKLAFAHTSFFTSGVMEELADLLVEVAPPGIERTYFLSGGSEAVEAAIKLARQYFVERGEGLRSRVIARRQSYHGNTLGALSASGNPGRRALYRPLLVPTAHVAPCYPYRERLPDESEQAYGLRAADALEETILTLGPETVMCFIAETVAGATLGAVPPTPGYFERIREICDRYGVLLILDEVMAGMGRTGTWFASEQFGARPDIVVIAKGLGAGYQPIGAVLCSGEVYRTIVEGTGAFRHGHTYVGHITACAAALAVQKTIRAESLLDNVRQRGADLADALVERFGNHRHVGEIRGVGLLMALEFVADRATKAPFPAEARLAARVKQRALDNGLICYPMGGIIDGRLGDHVLLAPPYIVEQAQIGELVDKLGRTVDEVLEKT